LSPRAAPFRQSAGKKVAMSNPGAARRLVVHGAKEGALNALRLPDIFRPQKVFNQSPEANAVLAETGPYDAELKASGHLVMAQALKLPNEAMTVQVRDGKMSATDGPFMETKEMLGGFILIDARDLNEAGRIAAGIPFAKLGFVEVRPIVDYSEPRPKL
jgi:hypothetical protein